MKKTGILCLAAAIGATAGIGGTIAIAGETDKPAKAEAAAEQAAAEQAAEGKATKKKDDPAIEKIGEPINCLHITNIRSSNVIDSQTIDFRTRNNKTYRNVLPKKCSRLGFEKSFSYRTSIARLCNVDIIRVLDNTGIGIQEVNACGLGKFQQIRKIKKK